MLWTFTTKIIPEDIKNYCPLSSKCLLPNKVYQGIVTSCQPNYLETVFFGVAENAFST